jgi:hypothetical protein
MIAQPIFLYDILVQIIIESLNFLFICPLFKPMSVPTAIDLVDQIPLLSH